LTTYHDITCVNVCVVLYSIRQLFSFRTTQDVCEAVTRDLKQSHVTWSSQPWRPWLVTQTAMSYEGDTRTTDGDTETVDHARRWRAPREADDGWGGGVTHEDDEEGSSCMDVGRLGNDPYL